MTSIGDDAFEGCINLGVANNDDITFPNNFRIYKYQLLERTLLHAMRALRTNVDQSITADEILEPILRALSDDFETAAINEIDYVIHVVFTGILCNTSVLGLLKRLEDVRFELAR